jgi:hypothetical protein
VVLKKELAADAIVLLADILEDSQSVQARERHDRQETAKSNYESDAAADQQPIVTASFGGALQNFQGGSVFSVTD